MTHTIEPILTKYIQAVEDLGTASYPDNYYEGQSSFKSKITGYPKGCYLARIDDDVIGYIISFPYILNEVYPINEHYVKVEHPSCLYIHDLCIDPKYRGAGIGRTLTETILATSDIPKALVSVLNSEPFWKRFGFIPQRHFDYYGGVGCYMTRSY